MSVVIDGASLRVQNRHLEFKVHRDEQAQSLCKRQGQMNLVGGATYRRWISTISSQKFDKEIIPAKRKSAITPRDLGDMVTHA